MTLRIYIWWTTLPFLTRATIKWSSITAAALAVGFYIA